MSVDYTPEQNSYKDLDSFRFWCQKVLPAVYDDSLSYYELLCKVVNWLNEVIENLNKMGVDVTSLYGAYTELQNWVNNYFDNLNVQNEINVKLNMMADDGTLTSLLEPFMQEFNAELTDVRNLVTGQLADYQNDINVISERVDMVTSLPNGSTAGDAELTDIRVGWNGTTYPTAGDAVRAQATSALQASGVNIYNDSVAVPPYDDMNTFPLNRVVMCSVKVANSPGSGIGTAVTFAFDIDSDYPAQFFFAVDGNLWFRSKNYNTWTSWKNLIIDTSEFMQPAGNAYNTSFLDSFDSAKVNTIWLISAKGIEGAPSDKPGNLITFGYSPSFRTQLYATIDGSLYFRCEANKSWTSWGLLNQLAYCDLSLFTKFGVIGDSYASGEMYFNGDYRDNYNISWGQILARKKGTTCTNYSKGGLTTRSWLTDNRGLPLLKNSEPEDIYYLVLGINDYYHLGAEYLGSIRDITDFIHYNSYNDSFYGNYGRIIEQIMEHAPNSKLVLFTTAGTSEIAQAYNEAIGVIAEHYGIPLVTLLSSHFFNSHYYQSNMVEGHPIAIVYSGMANAIEKLVTDCITNNVEYFSDCYMHD